jgi:7-keto-8-aminopelargonate synthetase-like enzyme
LTQYATIDSYYLARECFVEYLADHVNPARQANHLPPLDLNTAREVFRLLDEETWRGGQLKT